MGALASFEHCGCLVSDDKKFTKQPNTKYDSDVSSSEEEITTDDETELIKKKTKQKRKKKTTKNKERDESYILYSSDDSDNYNKTKKCKKKEDIIAEVQQSVMEISKNEVDKHSGLYGMDVKTMELLMTVNLDSQPPQPPMPSIASQPLNSQLIESVDFKNDGSIDTTSDMRQQLQSYTSNDMLSIDKFETNDSYNALLVDDNDNTPALPNNNNLNNTLGGLDYDFTNNPDNDEKQQINTLRHDEKDIHDLRIKSIVLQANNSRGPDELHELIKQQYTHQIHSHETDDVTDDESSYDEHEIQEIERMKTEEMNKKASTPKRQISKAKLFRANTTTPWHEDDMDDMHLAMTKEMEAMKQISKDTSNNSNNTNTNSNKIIMESDSNSNNNDYDYDTDEEYDTINDIDQQIAIKSFKNKDNTNLNSGTKTSQLFRLKSTYKWDKQRLEQENKDMQAQMVDLMMAHQNSIEKIVNIGFSLFGLIGSVLHKNVFVCIIVDCFYL